MGGGAWPFLVGGMICQVDSDNERDHGGKLGLSSLEDDYYLSDWL